MKSKFYRYVLCAIVAAMLLIGVHTSLAEYEQHEQITMFDLDLTEVLD